MKTYIQFCNPGVNWFNLTSLAVNIKSGMCSSKRRKEEWEIGTGSYDIKKGDRIFIICSQSAWPFGNTEYNLLELFGATTYKLDGVCFGGYFSSDPFEDPESEETIAEVQFDFAALPGFFPIVNLNRLKSEIPGFDWTCRYDLVPIEGDTERRFIEIVSEWMLNSDLEKSQFVNLRNGSLQVAYDSLFRKEQ